MSCRLADRALARAADRGFSSRPGCPGRVRLDARTERRSWPVDAPGESSMSVEAEAATFGGRTAWARNLAAPVRSFLSTEEGGAIVMLAAAIVAMVWANA